MDAHIIIVGGGLAGLLSCIRLAHSRQKVVLIDDSLPGAQGQLGGFAKFSGAKFSFPPAGLGLVEPAGSYEQLNEVIDQVVRELHLGTDQMCRSQDSSYVDNMARISDGNENLIRQYESIVLTPAEVNELIRMLTAKVSSNAVVMQGKVINIRKESSNWIITYAGTDGSRHSLITGVLFMAGGRHVGELLQDMGVPSQQGKGIDVGVRVEFFDHNGLRNLRSFGPDAKFISGNCRTFCLNFPGEIYQYPFESFSIPGGVVADYQCTTSNVGLLHRTKEKKAMLERLKYLSDQLENNSGDKISLMPIGNIDQAGRMLEELYGCAVANSLQDFFSFLGGSGLIDWSYEHRVHFPLLDWYWPVYGQRNSFKVDDGLYVVGDVAGHARGLLQAAVSGWLGAEEYLR